MKRIPLWLAVSLAGFAVPAFSADVAISALSAATTLAGTETLPCVQTTTKKCTVTQILAAAQPLDAALTAIAAGSDFVQFTGPTTSTKVFTLPNSTATLLSSAAAVTVAQGGTGIASGTSGGVPYFSGTGTIASSALLTQYGVLYGGGAGAAPVALAPCTTGQAVMGNTGAAPTCQTPSGSGISVQTITTTSTISNSARVVLCDATSGAVTVNLGAAATYQDITVKKIDSTTNACTVDANSTETIDGGLTATISAQYSSISLATNGTNWFIY